MSVYCINCKYITDDLSCTHPSNVSPVDGRMQSVAAWSVRANENKCGIEGRWFVWKDTPAPPMPPYVPPEAA